MGQELNEQAENSESFERFLERPEKKRKRVAEVARLVETEERVVNSEMLDMPESLKNRILMLQEA
ncbi:hypothetical protein WN944_029523 [Citrus x changshan-huyou]|uniref:Uncharacterized protein n=1 Tax=Citrus x changshan-huyou TaxID=2935761 RepID=A0AAP0QEY3_9ROSI